ncbi:unnamed protein product [Brassica oleracea]|uniref:Uncharacterized protein n=2 Tax=Brassica oleracea TaxID=3712 RepID=A0A0D3CW84_BRAOL|nr:unnamed protein product [Brassica oleracea]
MTICQLAPLRTASHSHTNNNNNNENETNSMLVDSMINFFLKPIYGRITT